MKTAATIPEEGFYTVTIEGLRYSVQVMDTMTEKSPSTREVRMAHFHSGSPRFPIPVVTLMGWGCTFTPAL